jgi:hypothetical protein
MLQASDWRTIWLIPCIAAGVIMVAFFLLFRDRTVNGEPVESADSG